MSENTSNVSSGSVFSELEEFGKLGEELSGISEKYGSKLDQLVEKWETDKDFQSALSPLINAIQQKQSADLLRELLWESTGIDDEEAGQECSEQPCCGGACVAGAAAAVANEVPDEPAPTGRVDNWEAYFDDETLAISFEKEFSEFGYNGSLKVLLDEELERWYFSCTYSSESDTCGGSHSSNLLFLQPGKAIHKAEEWLVKTFRDRLLDGVG